MPARCPACNAPLADGDRTCGGCGFGIEPLDGVTALAGDDPVEREHPDPPRETEAAADPGKTRPAWPGEPGEVNGAEDAAERTDPDTLPPGTVLWGRFRIEGEIDRGGMGVVYRARDSKLEDRPVAVKVLLAALAEDAGVRARFRNEVLTARDLRHTGIVGVYDYDDRGGHVGFAMELLEGHTLADHLAGRVPGSPLAGTPSLARLPAVATLTRALAGALDFVHDAGLIHRDVKPSNIMILGPPTDPAAWQVKLLDFGIVRVGDGSGDTGQVQPGTAEYMAPELLSGRGEPSRASDLFSLGKVIYRALTGERLEFLSEIDPPSQLVEGLPDTLDRPLVSCFGRPARRPKTATALAAAISDAAEAVRMREKEARWKEEEEEARRKAVEEEERRKAAEEEKRRKAAEEEKRRKAAEEEERRKAEEEKRRKATEEEERRKAEEEKRRKAEEEKRRKAAEEEERRRAAEKEKRRRRGALLGGAGIATLVGVCLLLLIVVLLAVVPGAPLRRWFAGSGAHDAPESPTPEPRTPEPATPEPPTPEPPTPAAVLPNPAGIDWVGIDGGTFKIGSDDGDSDEKKGPWITVPAFEMSRSEVTVAQYRRCVEADRCSSPGTDYDSCNWKYADREDHPVNCVDWDQAVAFARYAGNCAASGHCPVRLPSESEWEFAARSGGQDRKYPWGDLDATCEYAVMDDGGNGCGRDRTWEVCGKSREAPARHVDTDQGLCDMSGNVWEWVQDCYASDYANIPTNGKPWDPDSCSNRVLRGGSWRSDIPHHLRAANRVWDDPSYRYGLVGFRLARDVP